MPEITTITDKAYKPTLREIAEFIRNPLFDALCAHMEAEYKAACEITYSGDSNLPGWNVRFYKAGRTLCRLYPKRDSFSVLVVVGRKEKERAEAFLPQMSEETRKLYHTTPEGMGQRWLILTMGEPGAAYEDLLNLIRIRAGKSR